MAKVLKKAQAKAIYDALCALNNVGAKIEHQIVFDNGVKFIVYANGGGYEVSANGQCAETYETQSAFGWAYGL